MAEHVIAGVQMLEGGGRDYDLFATAVNDNELQARRVRLFMSRIIPGLLQTRTYATAVMDRYDKMAAALDLEGAASKAQRGPEINARMNRWELVRERLFTGKTELTAMVGTMAFEADLDALLPDRNERLEQLQQVRRRVRIEGVRFHVFDSGPGAAISHMPMVHEYSLAGEDTPRVWTEATLANPSDNPEHDSRFSGVMDRLVAAGEDPENPYVKTHDESVLYLDMLTERTRAAHLGGML